MERYRLYQHNRNNDVAISILDIFRKNEDGSLEVFVRYYNLASPGRSPWSMSICDRVTITAKELPNYTDITNLLE